MVLIRLGLKAIDSSIIKEDFEDEEPMEERLGGRVHLMPNL